MGNELRTTATRLASLLASRLSPSSISSSVTADTPACSVCSTAILSLPLPPKPRAPLAWACLLQRPPDVARSGQPSVPPHAPPLKGPGTHASETVAAALAHLQHGVDVYAGGSLEVGGEGQALRGLAVVTDVVDFMHTPR